MELLELPVGVRHKPTKASHSTSWREANLMRWTGGQLQPVGGWNQSAYDDTDSIVRKIHAWVTLDGIRMTAFLCEEKCYIDDGTGVLIDISPTTPIVPPFDPIAGGYGDNLYNFGDYGTPRPDVDRTRVIGPAYSVDNWGEDLLVMTSADGRLLRWKPSVPGTPLTVVPNAPLGRCFVVTPHRFVMIFGISDQHNRFAWCDQEDVENWTIGVTSKAGGFNVEPAAPIVTAIIVGNEVFFTTTTNLYVTRFTGMPYIYNYVELGAGATPFSSASIIEIPDGCIWAAESGWWMYNGSRVDPIDCDIWEWFTDDFSSIVTRREAFMVDLSVVSEVWWFFATEESESINRAMVLNYKEKWWTMGRISRTAGYSSSYTDLPIMANGVKIYFHEQGQSYAGSELPWVESYSINMDSGTRMMTLDQMLPDIEGGIENIEFIFYTRENRATDTPEYETSPLLIRDDGYLDIRETARDFRMRIQSRGVPVPVWTMGQTLYNAIPRGQR